MRLLLLRLYPHAWRARYEDEFLAVLEERGLSLSDVIDVLRGGVDARLRPQVWAEVSRETGQAMRLPQLGAAGAVLSGAMLCAMGLGGLAGLDRLTESWPQWLQFLLPLFFLLPAVGLYSLGRGHLGTLGRRGAMLAVGSLLMTIAGRLTVGFAGVLWSLVVLGLLGAFTGLTLIGVAFIRSRLLGRWSFLPLALGLVGLVIVLTGEPAHSALGYGVALLLSLLFASGWVLLGYALWSQRLRLLQQRRHDDEVGFDVR
jgi:hypothetical protein